MLDLRSLRRVTESIASFEDSQPGSSETTMQTTVDLPKAFSVREAKEIAIVQDLARRLNPKLRVVHIGTEMHIHGGPTVNWAVIYLDGEPLVDAEARTALDEAGLDFQHNAEIAVGRSPGT